MAPDPFKLGWSVRASEGRFLGGAATPACVCSPSGAQTKAPDPFKLLSCGTVGRHCG